MHTEATDQLLTQRGPDPGTTMAVLAKIFFSLSILTSLIIVVFIGEADVVLGRSQPREFDFFKLTMQWPGTVCQGTRHCCHSNGCCRGANAPTGFTIHGLWPDYNDGTWPACCSNSRPFDMKEISTLRSALNQYWPSLSCGSPSTCHGHKGLFWAHEWEKHGTCSYPAVRDEYDYFLTTLNLYFKYNVTGVLNEAGYVASNTEKYPLGGIVSAIENAFHASPEVVCKSGAVDEVRLCFYKDFKPRDCATSLNQDGVSSSSHSCPKYVSLPAYSSLGLQDVATEASLHHAVEVL